jgi:hypothetical protein
MATRETDGKTTSVTQFIALSWIPALDVPLSTACVHWAMENALLWQLDVSFCKDAARNRMDNSLGGLLSCAAARSRLSSRTNRRNRYPSSSQKSVGVTTICESLSITCSLHDPSTIALPGPQSQTGSVAKIVGHLHLSDSVAAITENASSSKLISGANFLSQPRKKLHIRCSTYRLVALKSHPATSQ